MSKNKKQNKLLTALSDYTAFALAFIIIVGIVYIGITYLKTH